MTTSTLTVTDFVLPRIAEDEAMAKRIARSPMNRWPQPDPHAGELGVFYDQGDGVEIHPARVLAQCAAMRKIVELHGPKKRTHSGLYCDICDAYEVAEGVWSGVGDLYPCDTILALASIWSDHPDFREEWRA